MARLKAKKQEKLIVVPYRPSRILAVRLFSMAVIIGLVVTAFLVGRQEGFGEKTIMQAQISTLQSNLSVANLEKSKLQQDLMNFERGKTVDVSALEEVRQANKTLRDEIGALEQEVALYKGIMAPNLGDRGLRVEQFSLSTTTSEQRFGFKLLMTQAGDNGSYIDGYVGVNLIGTRDGVREVIPLMDLSSEIDRVDVRFRYRYFQEIIGELLLPEGFEPYQVHVVAQSTGKKAQRIEKTYDWTELESLANVGQR